MRRKLAAGNWKMNGLGASLSELSGIAAAETTQTDVLICPPATLITRAVSEAGSVDQKDCCLPCPLCCTNRVWILSTT